MDSLELENIGDENGNLHDMVHRTRQRRQGPYEYISEPAWSSLTYLPGPRSGPLSPCETCPEISRTRPSVCQAALEMMPKGLTTPGTLNPCTMYRLLFA